jgi:hypothetical protein
LIPDHFDYIKKLLTVDASMYYRDMANSIYAEFQVVYSKDQVRRCLRANGITRKLLERHAKEQDPFLRRRFRDAMKPQRLGGIFTARQILSVDEVHANKKKVIIS